MTKRLPTIRYTRPELFFGLVGAVGSDLDLVVDSLRKSLKQVQYKTEVISMSQLLHSIDKYHHLSTIAKEDERIDLHMDAGNDFREDTKLKDALALLSIVKIWDLRRKKTGSPNIPLNKTAYVFRSLKHPAEIERFRSVYGRAFHLISVYSPRDARVENLAIKIKDSRQEARSDNYRGVAEELIARDESEREKNEYGQNVRDAYPNGDVFVAANVHSKIQTDINRFIELLFGNTFHTPTKDEFAMFVAQASARRSGSLARQVGAVISTDNGDIVASGMNEVPKFGGGFFGPEDEHDYRNLQLGHDPNDIRKKQILVDILQRLGGLGYLKTGGTMEDLAEKIRPHLKNADLMSIIEFAREVHAEMAALTTASRNTISTKDCTLYTTTFPCHDCTKHIIAAGIKRVVYVEPYPKSMAKELFRNLISVDEKNPAEKTVNFQPFVGISHSRYMQFFSMLERKDTQGKVLPWKAGGAIPRLWEVSAVYLTREVYAIIELLKTKKIKINLTDEEKKMIKAYESRMK